MRFKGLDLNLLVVFDSLMTTRSVSRTAEQLHLSQPAISSALRRLRDYFSDPILVTQGKRMFPTAHAESLLPQVRESLRVVEGLIATSTAFDPATSRRVFRICSSDYIATAVLAPLVRRLATEAPGVQLELMLNDERAWVELDQGGVDLIILPTSYSDHKVPSEHLLDERHVVVGWNRNPLMHEGLDEEAFMAAGHVRVAIGYARTVVFADRQCELQGRHRRVEATASSFGLVPWLLQGTMRLALMHERLARTMARHYPIAYAPVPFDFPDVQLVIQFQSVRAADPGLVWLRQQLKREAERPIDEMDAIDQPQEFC